MSYFSKRLVIHPEDKNDLAYWTKKWGVNVKQINEAIIETGSINREIVKNTLIKKGQIWTLSFWIHKLFKNPMRL
ncbi:MAG: DUF3606 domain-containing protein [Bacteroidetes bacterium]|nr:DUF3606 domain-containing protein [Bacteroidota bacterium]